MDYIKIPLYYQEDKEGNKEYDFRHMVSEFETELKKLDISIVNKTLFPRCLLAPSLTLHPTLNPTAFSCTAKLYKNLYNIAY